MSVEYENRGDVALITMNNPPVNGLGHSTRSGIVEGLRKALADDAVRAIVITGAGKAFSGGADIREFNKPESYAEPNLLQVIEELEKADKPVVAAVHSVAMGGGLELALGCHYRVAAPGAQIAFPEVKLGILPGAGGTQRMPRAVGVEKALAMIVSGDTILSDQLADTKLFDRMIAGEIVAGAVEFAKAIAAVRPLPKLSEQTIDFPQFDEFFQKARDEVRKKSGHFPAPLKCVECVAAAVRSSFNEGMNLERDTFIELVETTESKALRHYFFSERMAAKIPDVPEGTHRRVVKKAAVIGAGTMGGGIAMNFANAGIPVAVLEANRELLDRGLGAIKRNYENSLKKGKLTPEKLEERMNLIQGTLAYEEVKDADIVIEAVFEDIAVKEAVFRKLDDVMKPGAILASNTSTLDINRIAAFTKRPEDVIGTHFFSPAHVMKLLEIVRGAKTSGEVLATTMTLARKIRKIGVVSGVCDGFIGNRMIEQYGRQAGFLLEEGCLPEQIDKAMEEFGFAMGPFRMSDLAGNDVAWYIRKRRYVERPEIVYSKAADILCEKGRFGQKTGAGWYDYRPGDRKPYPSSWVQEMIIAHSREIGVERRMIGDVEIVERLVYALVNEAAYILAEGVAQRASDIDVVYLMGYGFPMHRGGPMFYADTVGLPNVLRAMEKYAGGRYGELWKPAPLLMKLAAEGKMFT
ncbi:MAG: 3-hydroxyacyl-CoA dehydrogenase NAD-binding domain-containing protein [Syntrophales bacterium]|jgi:3-hydroxyacyl-CoA dehydrogenase|nr:3-hydroxyacyl-CoA dehydrogenase NAD-binding domain-containing protein [Syntrophales bacterium]